MPAIATRKVLVRPTPNARRYDSAESYAYRLSPIEKPAGCVRKSKPLWMPRTRMLVSVFDQRNQAARPMAATATSW